MPRHLRPAPSRLPRASLPVLAALALLLPARPAAAQASADGYAVSNETLIAECSRCHEVDDEGRMSRISFMRKTPEGWQSSVRRMVGLHSVSLTPERAREVVRYLSDELGLAPEELRPALFEVERRTEDFDWDGDSDVEYTCSVCHSVGRAMTQRRTREEWGLLIATHRGLYPLADFQAFRRSGPAPTEPREDGSPPDARHPMDRAIDHLSGRYPLETPEWASWSANRRDPQLAGEWIVAAHQIGRGPVFGVSSIAADPEDPAAFATRTQLAWAESGERAERTGRALVYTGYQWRGRSNPDEESEMREALFVERDQSSISGRWFRGAYDELGIDVSLRRIGAAPFVAGVHPEAARRGERTTVTLYGGSLPASAGAGDFDFGRGVSVLSARPAGEIGGQAVLELELEIAADAPAGRRDLFAFGEVLEGALAVHDGISRIGVSPESGMARIGGIAFPKGYQSFDAIGYASGPDGEPGTADDLPLGRVPASWSLEEYTATFGDDDLAYVGAIDPATGLFTPAADGPNPERAGQRNNVGDVWVVASLTAPDGAEFRARAHLLVTVPNYLRFEPWREVGR